MQEVVDSLETKRPSVAYIGASNLDSLEVYHLIFKSAMRQVEVGECRMVPTRPDDEAVRFLKNADIILLAGGDVEIGWRAFEENGFSELIRQRYLEGALLMGISAGAVQLGRGWISGSGPGLIEMFGLLPFHVGAHEEADDWASLRKVAGLAGRQSRAIGIPAGGGIKYASNKVEAICRPLAEIIAGAEEIHEQFSLSVD